MRAHSHAANVSAAPVAKPRYGCVVLTQGRRPELLREGLESLVMQTGVEVEACVVGNGWSPEGLPDGVHAVGFAEDVGIPAGRNAGVPRVSGELLFFLDDDAALAEPDALARVAGKFRADPRLGMLQLRVDPRGQGPAAREWVPRLRVGDRARSSDVPHVWEGAVAMRRDVFDAVGGWPAEFRFVHEGVDLGWKVMDAGYRVHYAGDVAALHPAYQPSRNDYAYYFGARNRVWLARRYLPLPLAIPFVATFAMRTLPRLDSPAKRRAALRGYRDGLRGPGPGRRPLGVRTLARMTRLGRPPIV
jgi:GT2 family glycosyltransferase